MTLHGQVQAIGLLPPVLRGQQALRLALVVCVRQPLAVLFAGERGEPVHDSIAQDGHRIRLVWEAVPAP